MIKIKSNISDGSNDQGSVDRLLEYIYLTLFLIKYASVSHALNNVYTGNCDCDLTGVV